MPFLPIAERELRVASRKRRTFLTRIIAAVAALMIGAGVFGLTNWQPFAAGMGFAGGGHVIFQVLTWLILPPALMAGLFFTSDCLSEEKREGTLGLLFLTDLAGHDVVLGKLLASSLTMFYTVFALMPIIAVTLLLGGVTGREFWMTSVALIVTTVYSLAAGMFVSAVSRDPQRAMGGTVLLMLVIAGLGPIIEYQQPVFHPVASMASPIYLCIVAHSGASIFWTALAANLAVAALLLGAACVLLPRTWQQKGNAAVTAAGSRMGAIGRRGWRARRRKLLDRNPLLWLAARERWLTALFWTGVALMALSSAAAIFAERSLWSRMVAGWLQQLLVLGLELALASQAGRFFVDARRSGLMESVLVTTVEQRQIVQGQWQALLRMAALPIALFLTMNFVTSTVVQARAYRAMASATYASRTTTITTKNGVSITNTTVNGAPAPGAPPVKAPALLSTVGLSACGAVSLVANLVALAWFGMWMGLTSRTPHLATLKTVSFVQLIPWVAITFASTFSAGMLMFYLTSTGRRPGGFEWFPLVMAGIATALTLIKAAVFTVYARKKLYDERAWFRASLRD